MFSSFHMKTYSYFEKNNFAFTLQGLFVAYSGIDPFQESIKDSVRKTNKTQEKQNFSENREELIANELTYQTKENIRKVKSDVFQKQGFTFLWL